MRPVTSMGRVASALSVGLALAALGGCILFTNSTDGYTQAPSDASVSEAAPLFEACPSEAGCSIACLSQVDCVVDGGDGGDGLICCFGELDGGALGSACMATCGTGPQLCKQTSECRNGSTCLQESCFVNVDFNFCGACPAASVL